MGIPIELYAGARSLQGCALACCRRVVRRKEAMNSMHAPAAVLLCRRPIHFIVYTAQIPITSICGCGFYLYSVLSRTSRTSFWCRFDLLYVVFETRFKRPRPKLYFFLSTRRLETKTLSRGLYHCFDMIWGCELPLVARLVLQKIRCISK